jgi:hypothetical protein
MSIVIARLGNSELLDGGHVEYDPATDHITMLFNGGARPLAPGELLKLSTQGYVLSWTEGWEEWLRRTLMLVPLEISENLSLGASPVSPGTAAPYGSSSQTLVLPPMAHYPQSQQPQVLARMGMPPLRRANVWNQLSLGSIFVGPLVDLLTLGMLGWIVDIFGWAATITGTVVYLRAKRMGQDPAELRRARIWLWVSWGSRILSAVLTVALVLFAVSKLSDTGVFNISQYQHLLDLLRSGGNSNTISNLIGNIVVK